MQNNMTAGSPAKLIFQFTVPVFIGNVFQQFYSMADTLIVGRTIGANALAAVGCTGVVNFLIIGFVTGLTSGLAIVTAQRFGSGDAGGVRRSFAVSILISAAVTAVVTAAAVPLTRPLLQLLQTPPEILNDADVYLYRLLPVLHRIKFTVIGKSQGAVAAASWFFPVFSTLPPSVPV